MPVECFMLSPTPDAPNSPLPVLVYRNVLPTPRDEESATAFLTRHAWEKRGTWGHIDIRHFHPNSHECYGIFRGHSTLLIGKIQEGRGQEIPVNQGDVILLPAGTAHSSLESSPDYRYIGVYPEGCPKWRNETGKSHSSKFVTEVRDVAMPTEDPIYGAQGPLLRLWSPRVLAKL
ncbi:hypothetical protein F5X68DRAFT_219310 [Plectosphaerella plurivora]|uniref:Uncharacterized protein n=1 Tax=Plectosphaerella plurivora TaxID=936078 RepID=A0A9P9AF96_9PEZI|nr:hypothetical protein F5X68DRAFT_219310 [Plectosphaerella plurivora]